ncbi:MULTISPECIES: hypothetical protein [unclassified Streptomyces]|uniref:hypothetical protein n=1 Tax=unclassified Streptomyces TaxID=2593676 RepID=UPI0030787EE8
MKRYAQSPWVKRASSGAGVHEPVQWWAMGAGIAFHLAIALTMGLWSFALAMSGGIVVL